ncbi:B12-binding domain-containing radical SAM protein [Magnetofaba australis]|uniref:Putative radical SAM domain-containing protein n=1 Tax=Magnetofaba australis IT-1 TaxID=1434232 RepID=A0A1Y2K2V0_9PROT|nr:radical SAM protein [Magnetofaba australis]OSM01926.1 putative radical SAM domain-containing protein [Magnetofaba australis IT-1]
MNILFAHPPSQAYRTSIYMPLAMGQLIAFAEQAGHTVVCADLHNHGMAPEAIQGFLKKEHFDVCLMSGFASQVKGMRETIASIRQTRRELPVVLGGLGVSYLPETALNYTGADAIATGEGEPMLLPLLDAIAERAAFNEVPSLTFRQRDGALIQTPLAPVIEDLDALPLMAYHHFDMDLMVENDFFTDDKRSMVSWSLRGCAYSCDFCTNSVEKNPGFLNAWPGGRVETKMPGRVRARSGWRVAEEWTLLKERYGIENIFLADLEFMASRKHVEDVCRAVAPLDMSWWVMARPEVATEEKLTWMKRSGCHYVNYGIESISPEICRNIHRSSDLPRITAGIRAARTVGMTAQVNFIVGLPGETVESVRDSVEFCRDNDLIYLPTILQPFPGTMIFERYRQRINLDTLYDDIADRWDMSWRIAYNFSNMSDRQLLWVRKRAMSLNVIHIWVTKQRALAWLLSWSVTLGLILFEGALRRYRVGVRHLVRLVLGRANRAAQTRSAPPDAAS